MFSSATFTRARRCESGDAEKWVADVFAQMGMALDRNAVRAFALYLELLVKWNRKVNLTAIRHPRSIVKRHFVDSALVLDHAPIVEGAFIADIGSGAGFPGVPIAILRPRARVVLWEPAIKKASFLHTVVARLGLENVTVMQERVEPKRIPEAYLGAFDGVVSRYTASLGWLAACARPMVHAGGWLVASKYADAKEKADLSRIVATVGAFRAEWRPDPRLDPNRCFAVFWFP